MKWPVFYLSLALLVIGILPAYCTPAPASPSGSKTAIILVLDGATRQELRSPELPNISNFLQSAAVGLMNTKGPQDADPTSVWVTLGAGRMATAHVQQLDISRDDPARIGNFSDIVQANQRSFTQAKPGLLGETLANNGIERTLIRLGSWPDMAPILAADLSGTVPRLLNSTSTEVMSIISEDSGLIVISLTLPHPAYQEYYPSKFDLDERRMLILKEADAVLGKIVQHSSSEILVGLLSPSCPKFSSNYVRALAPIAFKGQGFSSGLLNSAGTHRTGLVASVDFAPTILSFFDISIPENMTGVVLQSTASPAPLATLDNLDRQIAVTHRLREDFGRKFILIAGSLLSLVLILLLVAPTVTARAFKLLKFAMFLVASSVLAIFFLSAASIDNTLVFLFGVLLLAGIIAAAASRLGRFPISFGIICLATAAAFWADLLFGSPIMRRCLLGFDAIAGYRFYGLGNFEGGIFASAVILSAGILLDYSSGVVQRRTRLIIACFVILAVFSIGASFLGSNWGQGLSAAFTALMLWLLLSPTFLRKKRFPLAGILFLLAAGIFISIDISLPSARESHLAHSFKLILGQGPDAILAIIGRKLLMAWRISAYSPFLFLAVFAFAGLILFPLRTPRRLRYVVDKYPAFTAALAACGMGGVAASLLNDSGIAAGIAIICLPVIGLVLLALEATRENFGH